MADFSIPGWQTEELEEEWVSQPSSPANNQDGDGNGEIAVLTKDKQRSAPYTPTRCSSVGGSIRLIDGLREEEDSYQDDNEPDAEECATGGTFLIREDQPLPVTPLGLKPGQAFGKKAGIKTFFTPLALERMFDPPSPPQQHEQHEQPSTVPEPPSYSQRPPPPTPPPPKPIFTPMSQTKKPSKLSQSYLPADFDTSTETSNTADGTDGVELEPSKSDEILASDIPGLTGFDGRKPSADFQFTFTMSPHASNTPHRGTHLSPPNFTPNPRARQVSNGSTILDDDDEPDRHGPEEGDGQLSKRDSRLRLFQYQYDTFTREHLSALVDTIAVKSSPPENSSSREEDPVWRSSKRIKLSPPEDWSFEEREREDDRQGDLSPWGKVQTAMSQLKSSQPTPETAEKDPREETPPPPKASTKLGKRLPTTVPKDAPPSRVPSTSSSTTAASASATPPIIASPPKEDSDELPIKKKSINYRLQGANLLAQIKNDIGGDLSFGHAQQADKSRLSTIPDISLDGSLAGDAYTHHESDAADDSIDGSVVITDKPPVVTKTASLSRKSPRKLLRRLSAADEVDKEIEADTDSILDGTSVEAESPVEMQPGKNLEQLRAKHLPGFPDQSTLPQTLVFSAREIAFSSTPVGALAHGTPSVAIEQNVQSSLPQTRRRPSSAPLALRPNHPTHAQEDMNRFVSSSTAASGMSGTTAGSFVKHAGPPAGAHMRTIRPQELQGVIPDRVGGMIFSKTLGKWVREDGNGDASEDPFGDIESLDAETPKSAAPSEVSVVEEVVESILTSSLDDASQSVESSGVSQHQDAQQSLDEESYLDATEAQTEQEEVSVAPTSIEYDDEFSSTDDGTDSILDDTQPTAQPPAQPFTLPHQPQSMEELSASIASISLMMDQSPPRPIRPQRFSQQIPAPTSTPGPKVPPKSALKQTPFRSTTWDNGISGPSIFGGQSPTRNSDKKRRRSVSFSDGKLSGQIRGLLERGHESQDDEDVSKEISEPLQGNSHIETTTESMPQENGTMSSYVPSTRTKRIQNLLDGMNDSDTFATQTRTTDVEPASKRSSASAEAIARARAEALAKLEAANPSAPPTPHITEQEPSSQLVRSFSRTKRKLPGDETFLTEASFKITQDRLVQALTSVQPYEPHWEQLRELNLNKKNIDGLARLNKFVPNLDKLSVDGNQLAWLSGVPATIRTLSLSRNLLTSATTFSFLPNLEFLNISYNQLDSLKQLEQLRHLRELRADGNQIESLEGIFTLDSLVKISLRGNKFRVLDLRQQTWPHLEVLDLSENRVKSVVGLGRLPALISLNLDGNELSTISADTNLAKLRVLRLSANRLTRLDVATYPNLRTLYVDNNRLESITNGARLIKLENLSVRSQGGDGLHISFHDFRDVKRLYFSGNPFNGDHFVEPFYNLVYLELAACKMTSIPSNISQMAPNLRVLNLNYNFITDVRPLAGLARLRKLTIVGSRIKGSKSLIRVLQKTPEMELADFRMNPFSLGWYLPLIISDLPSALQPSEEHDRPDDGEGHGVLGHPRRNSKVASWQALDDRFRRDLPDEVYLARMGFRGLVLRACERLTMFDGIEVTMPEREKSAKLLRGLEKSVARTGGTTQSNSTRFHDREKPRGSARAGTQSPERQ
ncbi:hypothetical protein FRC02_007914 [Tulasnella sp. 418]|nr:hypothetical protein FRC02_007914 [Tulasnella sp. 418]